MDAPLIHYVRELQADPSWTPFLGTLGQELEAQLAPADLRVLMARVGQRFAASYPLGASATLPELQVAMNERWSAMRWGLVSLEESSGFLRVNHQLSPLVAVLGETSASWSAAFLEGVYQAWFTAMGIDPALKIRQAAEPDALGSVEFRLERKEAPVPKAPSIFA